MENENKDYQGGQNNDGAEPTPAEDRAEKVAQDISNKISEAAAEIQDEVDSANEAAEGEVEEEPEYEDIFEAAYAGEEGYGEEEETPADALKEPKKVTMTAGAFVLSLIGCAVVGALVFFLATSIPTWIESMPEGSSVATVNGEKITDLDIQYYIYSTAMNKFNEMSQDDPSADIASFDWDQTVDGDKKLSDVIKEEALQEAKMNLLTIQAAMKNGMEWTEQEESQIQGAVNNFVSQYGEDGFQLRAKTMGISTVKQYARMYTTMTQYSNAQAKIEEDINAFIPEGTDLNEFIQDDRASVQHILIKSTASATPSPSADPAATPAPTEDPKVKAETVLASAKSGEDFAGLMDTYNEDTGETETGYTFKTGEMDPAFEEAAFALKIGDISDLVQSSYGYHIIKRVPGMYELQGYLESQAKISENKNKLNQISVADVMKMANDANEQLQQEQSAAQSSGGSSSGSSSSQG